MNRGGSLYYYHANRLGSTYLLSNSTAGIAERYAYSPYGTVAVSNSAYTSSPGTVSSVGNPYLFTGRELDAESGLYNYRARTYDPVLGRFKQLDPIGLDGGVNLYEYASDSPELSVDPTGSDAWAVYCRDLIPGVKAARHCFIVCNAHSYGMEPDKFLAITIQADWPNDKRGKSWNGDKYVSGVADPGTCDCLKNMAKTWQKTNPGFYNESDCNSNYFMKTMLDCCIPKGRDELLKKIKQKAIVEPYGMQKCTDNKKGKLIHDWLAKCNCLNKALAGQVSKPYEPPPACAPLELNPSAPGH